MLKNQEITLQLWKTDFLISMKFRTMEAQIKDKYLKITLNQPFFDSKNPDKCRKSPIFGGTRRGVGGIWGTILEIAEAGKSEVEVALLFVKFEMENVEEEAVVIDGEGVVLRENIFF